MEQELGAISPLWIVDDVEAAVAFYEEQLGFAVRFIMPGERPFFAIVGRGRCAIFLKHVVENVHAQPNPERHEWAPWDAFVSVSDPDGLADEFASRGVVFHKDIGNREDGCGDSRSETRTATSCSSAGRSDAMTPNAARSIVIGSGTRVFTDDGAMR